MALLIPEIHPGNVLFYWLLSFFARVDALYFHPRCVGVRRVGQVGGADAFSCEDGWAFRARAVSAWEAMAQRIPRSHWQATYRGIDLDFTNKARQDLCRAFDDFLLLKAIQQERNSDDVYLVPSARMVYLFGLDGASAVCAGVAVAPWVSRVHRLLDRVWEGSLYVATVARLANWLSRGLLAPAPATREALPPCSILYLCDNTNELQESSDRRSFSWLIDGQRIERKDVLIVLPDAADSRTERSVDALSRSSFQVGRIRTLYGRLPAARLSLALGELIKRLPSSGVAPLLPVRRSMVGRYLLSVIEFDQKYEFQYFEQIPLVLHSETLIVESTAID